MRNYLSFGGGVNSVAMMLMLLDQGVEFEAVMCDTGCEWPETYEYVDMFQKWLKDNNHNAITILKPCVEGYDNLYTYCYNKKLIPSRQFKWCTDKFKQTPQKNYFETPCFVYIGIDYGEEGRAKIVGGDIEQRYPLIESEIDRNGCKKIITEHGLPLPRKSSCYICYNAKSYELRELRTLHPELICNIRNLEDRCNKDRKSRGKKPIYIKNIPIEAFIQENQIQVFKQDEYPPCQCGL